MKNQMYNDVHQKICENMELIARQLPCRPLFGAIGGSLSLNLQNEKSDVDVYLITDNDGPRKAEIKHICLNGLEMDIMYARIGGIAAECDAYANAKHAYPSRFHRGQKETEEIAQCKDIKRPGFLREMVMRIYLADKTIEFETGASANNYEKLKNGLRLIDIWDAYFSRAAGNYEEKIKGREKVLRRKYLYCIHEIMLCHSLLEKKEKPAMNFSSYFYKNEQETLPDYIDSTVKNAARLFWEENRRIRKKKEEDFVCADLQLNAWIEQNLKRIADGMLEQEQRLTYACLPFA